MILEVLFWADETLLRRGSAAVLSAVQTDIPRSGCVVRDKEPAATCAILRSSRH